MQHPGPERVFWDAAPVVRGSDGLLTLSERRRPLGEFATASATFQAGQVRTTLLLATGGTYNRIEGLPIVFGPLFEFRPSPSIYTRLDLRGILRTAGQSTDSRSDFGYGVRGDVRFAGGTEWGLSGRLYSEVEPIEDQPSRHRGKRLVGVPAAARLSRLLRAERRRRARPGSIRSPPSGSSSRCAGTQSSRSARATRGRCSGTAIAGDAIR